MHFLPKIAAVAFSLSLAGCATSLFNKSVPAGTPLAEVTARLGKPTEVYAEPDGGQVLEYRGQPMGQFQHMARIGADGKLVSYEQVLTSANFARVDVNHWTRDDILRHFGRPAEVSRVRFENAEVWSYRYKEDGVWNSMMNVYFNERGIVRQLRNEPDPLLDDRYKGF
jgi:outer membrane protein assembly factor BamE (lipoprotein component of BamABCDE complex)